MTDEHSILKIAKILSFDTEKKKLKPRNKIKGLWIVDILLLNCDKKVSYLHQDNMFEHHLNIHWDLYWAFLVQQQCLHMSFEKTGVMALEMNSEEEKISIFHKYKKTKKQNYNLNTKQNRNDPEKVELDN